MAGPPYMTMVLLRGTAFKRDTRSVTELLKFTYLVPNIVLLSC